jgi:hypothetical protein
MKHFDAAEDFNFRGEWVKVNPSNWIPRVKSTVRVGTGTGDTRAKQAALQNIMVIQEKIMAMPGQALCNPSKLYATLDDACKFAGLNGAGKYFVNPDSPQGQQATQQADQKSQQDQQKQEQMTIEQFRQQAEIAKSATTTAEAQQMNVKLKGEVELAKHQHAMEKLSLQAQNDELKNELAQSKILVDTLSSKNQIDKQLDFDYDKLHTDAALKLIDIEATAKQDEKENFLKAQQIVESEEETEGGEND